MHVKLISDAFISNPCPLLNFLIILAILASPFINQGNFEHSSEDSCVSAQLSYIINGLTAPVYYTSVPIPGASIAYLTSAALSVA